MTNLIDSSNIDSVHLVPISIYFIFNVARVTAQHIEKTIALIDGSAVTLVQFSITVMLYCIIFMK